MRKGLLSAIAVLLMLTVVLWGSKLYTEVNRKLTETPQIIKKQRVTPEDYEGPDFDYLKYYGMGTFETTLPVLFIDTKDNRVSKENKVWASIAVLNNKHGEAKSIEMVPDYVAPITIKYRGASSYSNFDKSQYRIEFYKKEGGSKPEEYAFLGMGLNSEWVLHGPFLDKTLLRNRLIYNVSRDIFEWAPDNRFVELFVDGKYQGVYLAVEPVTNGASRLRLSEFGLLSGETAYLISRDRIGTEEIPLDVYGKVAGKTNNDLFVKYPSSRKITKEQLQWIEKDISKFEKVLYSNGFDDPVNGYAKYIDVDSFIDYVVLNEAVMNNDAGNLSSYFYKELGGKLKVAVWDFNNSYDNYQWFEQDFTEIFMKKSAWFNRLLQDRAFVDKVVKRYEELRRGVLSTELLHQKIDDYQRELGGAIERNFAIWGYSFDRNLLTGEGRDLKNYESAILQLKQAITRRLDYLDHHISDLYEDCVN